MLVPEKCHHGRANPAFTLIEMVAVIAVLVVLMTAGVSLMNGTGSQARKAGTDLLAGMIEQARTSAITSRSFVVLAIAEPGDLPAGDECCRLGLFKVESWPQTSSDSVNGILMSRWRSLESGITLIGGRVDGVDNPLDSQELTICYKSNNPLVVKVHAIVFNSRGGLHLPAGSSPIAMRIAEGNYRNGKAAPYKRGENQVVAENRLKIGRVTACAYRIDG